MHFPGSFSCAGTEGKPIHTALIVLAGLVVVAGMLWAMFPFSTPTTCSWPEPDSSNVQLQAREVKAALNIKNYRTIL